MVTFRDGPPLLTPSCVPAPRPVQCSLQQGDPSKLCDTVCLFAGCLSSDQEWDSKRNQMFEICIDSCNKLFSLFKSRLNHRCVQNHGGSARSMESSTGLKGVKELIDEGTPVEYIEGDGDNTLITRLRSELNLEMKKRFDKNHVVKNIGKC
eukprot:XP_019928577.1 PREDICTED: uncharacterized protein LOC109620466 [Crassostrea gigas]